MQPTCPWCQGLGVLLWASGSRQGSLLGPLTVPCWVGQVWRGQAIGGKRPPEPRGWVDWARWAPLGRDLHLFVLLQPRTGY